ncbi:MAG: DUF1214 domain-containing protein [Acidimicrobiales bacterium]
MTASEDLRTAWIAFCDDLKGAVDHVVDPERDVADEERAEGVRHVLRMLSMQLDQVFENEDPRHPELGWVYPSKMGQDNPDGLYQTAPMDLHHAYRLSGNVGSVRSLGFSVMTWTFGGAPIRQLLELDGRDLPVDRDGNFEIVFSPAPPPAGTVAGTWFRLEPLETRLLVRQFFADWTNERPADLHIECLDVDGPPARLTPEEVIDKLGRTASMTGLMASYWTAFAEGHLQRDEINAFGPAMSTDEGGELGGTIRQAYGQCMWRVGPGEALVFEVTPPTCHYWEVQLGDRWYQSLDYVNRPITINDAQAVLDDDGVFRLVIAPDDPRVANWLDTAGVADGYLTYRYNLPESEPVPTLTLMAADDLATRLPATTPRVTPTERAAASAARRRGALRRFRR